MQAINSPVKAPSVPSNASVHLLTLDDCTTFCSPSQCVSPSPLSVSVRLELSVCSTLS